MLSVSFQITDMRRDWGGCAGYIAYNLHALGGDPVVMGTLGTDGGAYRERLRTLGIAIDGVRVIDDAYTAQAFIITDHDDNQITAFHPGAMNRSHVAHVDDVADVSLGIVSPDGKEGMTQHAAEFAARGTPFVFDPGQGLPLFDGKELAQIIEHASYLTVNDYEAKLLADRTGWSIADIAERVDGLVVTMGGEGSIIHAGGATYAIPAVRPSAIVDPTGCGDAYRAGLLYGIANEWDWESTGKLASVMGTIKIECRGGQNHVIDRDTIALRYRDAFGELPW
jgi:adenosine kinase